MSELRRRASRPPATTGSRQLKRIIAGIAVAVAIGATVVGVEVWLALRRDYLPTDHPLELHGIFGDRGGTPLNFVVLGDSTAAGIGVSNPSDAYPTLLATRLATELDRRVELTVLAVSGARTRDVLHEQTPRVAALKPDLVFVAIGANDVTHVTPLDEIRRDMTAALEALQSTGATVVVAGAPDMRVLAWLQPLRQLSYWRGLQVTNAIEEVAREHSIPVVELAKETGPLFAADPEAHFSEDEFHPSAQGYRRWADAIFPVLVEALEGQEEGAP